jgi:hypothetical protein
MDLTTLLGGDLMKWLQLFMFGQKLQQDRRNQDKAEEDDERAIAAMQRPSIIPWNFPNANGRRAMIVPGMWNAATGAYAPSETIWADQYTAPTDDDDDDALLDDYVNQ